MEVQNFKNMTSSSSPSANPSPENVIVLQAPLEFRAKDDDKSHKMIKSEDEILIKMERDENLYDDEEDDPLPNSSHDPFAIPSTFTNNYDENQQQPQPLQLEPNPLTKLKVPIIKIPWNAAQPKPGSRYVLLEVQPLFSLAHSN